MATLPVIIATAEDTPSLSTIVTRAFHKTNEYFRTTFPDTPLIRKWWSDVFLDAIHDPAYYVLTVVANDTEPRRAIGVLLLHRTAPGEKPAAVCLRHALTADHDEARYSAMLEADDGDVDDLKQLTDRVHFGIELLGVDSGHQGAGLGKKLLDKACEIASAECVPIVVSANLKASSFYEKSGFKCLNTVILPGSDGYGEAFLLYDPSTAQT